MKYIQKRFCPSGLARYKRCTGSSFLKMQSEALEAKNELREQLLTEQGYICGYCGSQIDEKHSVIEHLKCRAKYPKLQLEYENMICSCNGGKDHRGLNPQYPLYCDASKGSQDIPVSPLDECCSSVFIYDDMGNIHNNDSLNAEITIDILQLNNTKLKNRRRRAIDSYRYLSDDDIDWEEELQALSNYNNAGKYGEFCFVLEQYIKNYRLP